MIQFYAYISVNENKNKEELTTIINQLFPSYFLTWEDNIGIFSVSDDPSFQLKLEKIHSSAFFDLNIQCSILIVPYYNKIFLKYLRKLNNEVSTAFEIFLRSSSNKETIKDANAIKNSFSEDNINTIKAYLKSNGNANACAEELFLHKNSYAYRIKKFTSETFYDYNDLNTLLFLKLILSLVN